ncbi:immunoglobulin-like domain-containing protein [Treponema sp.]|uniref:immunoglobulin-like domain-containing protein n=1 Tax=Treponema sp. TaxID=166 RepID=UPI003FA2D3BD
MNYDDAKTSARPFMKPLSTCIALVAAVMFFGCKQNIGTESKTPAAQYKVTVEKTSGGNVTVTPALPESGMVNKNTELTFTATMLGGYKFVKWEHNGADTGVTEPTYKLTVTQAVRIKAVFTVDGTPITKHTVTLTPPVNGTVTSVPEIPSDKQVADGTEITFTATAQSGYAVEKWTVSPNTALKTGGAEGSQTATITITADTTVKVKFKPTLTDQEKVEKAKEALQLSFQNGDTADNISSHRLNLPVNGLQGTKISWQSNGTNIIEIKKENEWSYGSITRPEENTQVTLTATITKGAASATKSFIVTVRGTNEDAVISAAEQAVRAIPSFMTKDTSPIQLRTKETVSVSNGSSSSSVEVEVTINWDANPAGVISVPNGTVTPHETEIKKVTLTATAKKGNAQTQKTIEVTVYPKNKEPDLQTVVANIINTIPAEIDADIQLPQAPSGYKLTWSSSNDSILKIEENSGYIETWDLVDRTVELTATLEKNAAGGKAIKPKTLTIKARKQFRNGSDGSSYEFDGNKLTVHRVNGEPAAVYRVDINPTAKTITATLERLTYKDNSLMEPEEVAKQVFAEKEFPFNLQFSLLDLQQKTLVTLQDIKTITQQFPDQSNVTTDQELFERWIQMVLPEISYEEFSNKNAEEQSKLIKKALKSMQNSLYKESNMDENTPLTEAFVKMKENIKKSVTAHLEKKVKQVHIYQYRIEGDQLTFSGKPIPVSWYDF